MWGGAVRSQLNKSLVVEFEMHPSSIGKMKNALLFASRLRLALRNIGRFE